MILPEGWEDLSRDMLVDLLVESGTYDRGAAEVVADMALGVETDSEFVVD